jgi:acetoin utilization deacetylase AcuC-like enzyme
MSSAPVGYVLDEIYVHHRAPSGHPERPERAVAAREALVAAHVHSRATRVAARPASDEELARVHRASYLDELARVVPGRSGWLDADTYFSPGTWDAARAAVGAACELASRVMSGELARAIAVVRPPGHHATPDRAMGFCLLNNVAAAAAAARAAGAARVAILDWDVHHGNGTQDIFWNDPDVLYTSVHQFPFYPGTGAPTELGGERARGATVNVGLPMRSTDFDYLATFDHVLVPAIARFAPDVLLISAGFDAYEHDPLAGMRVTRAGFAAMAARVRALAKRACGDRLVAVLEGGYDLDGIGGGMAATLEAMLAPSLAPHEVVPLPAPQTLARAAIDGTLAAHAAAGVPIPAPEAAS